MKYYNIFRFVTEKVMEYFSNLFNVLLFLCYLAMAFIGIKKDSKWLMIAALIIFCILLFAICVDCFVTYHDYFSKIPNPLGIHHTTAVQQIVDAGFRPPNIEFIVTNDPQAVDGYVSMVKIDGKPYNKESIYQKEQKITLYALLIEKESDKASDIGYSQWSEWTIHSYNPDNAPQFGRYALIEIEDLGMQSTTNYYMYTLGDPITKTELIDVGTIRGITMEGYKVYYRDGQYYAIKKEEDWKDVEQVSLAGSTKDTLSVRYTYLGLDEERANTIVDADGLQKYGLWKREERKVGIVNYEDNTITYPSGEVVQCVAIEGRIYIVGEVEIFVAYETICTPIMKDTYYYRQRTRKN